MWKVLVLCVLVGGGAKGQSWLDNITDDLLEGTLRDMQTSVVNYSKPVINVTYIADFEFDMRAMGHLYNSTHMIIDFIANKQAYPEGKSFLLNLRTPKFIQNFIIINVNA